MHNSNILNVSANGSLLINSPGTSFGNDLSEKQIERKIYKEFEFFTETDEYFKTRDAAIISIYFTGNVGEPGQLPLNGGMREMGYLDLVQHILEGCEDNTRKVQKVVNKIIQWGVHVYLDFDYSGGAIRDSI